MSRHLIALLKLIIHFQFHQITQEKWGIIYTNPLDHFPNGAFKGRIYGYFGVLGCLKHLKSDNIKLQALAKLDLLEKYGRYY